MFAVEIVLGIIAVYSLATFTLAVIFRPPLVNWECATMTFIGGVIALGFLGLMLK